MSPRNDNQESEAKPGVSVDISHDEKPTPPAPATAPPLPELEPLPPRPINIIDNPTPPPPVVPAVPPISPHEFHEHEGRRWPVILIYTVLAFLVALLVVFAGRWIYRKSTHHTSKPITTQGNVPPAPTTSNQKQGQGTNPTSGAGQNQTTQTTPQTAANNTQLPNNGPGDVVAIFIGTALAVGGLHYIYSLRRQA